MSSEDEIPFRTSTDAADSEATKVVAGVGSAFDFDVTALENGKLHPSEALGPLHAVEARQEAGGKFSWAIGVVIKGSFHRRD